MTYKTRPVKPIEVEAVQWTAFNIDEIMKFVYPIIPEYMSGFSTKCDSIFGLDLESGFKVVQLNDWIVKTKDGKIVIYNPEIFKRIFTEG